MPATPAYYQRQRELAFKAVGALDPNGPTCRLVLAATRGVEAIDYLVAIDEQWFGDVWARDTYANESIDDAHVRWAATSALSCIDQSVAVASRIGRFRTKRREDREDSIRSFYSDGRRKEPWPSAPWGAWLDDVVGDPDYNKLHALRNSLVHGDTKRLVHLSTTPLAGHRNRFGYWVGDEHLLARPALLLCLRVATTHVGRLVETLVALHEAGS